MNIQNSVDSQKFQFNSLEERIWVSLKTGNNLFILTLVVSIFLNYSCTNSSSQKNKFQTDTTICDSYNRNVTFLENPQQIISAAPGITEVIFALGEGKRLVGRTDFCDYPMQVKSIPSIGGIEDPNFETIAAINPHLIIASTHFLKESVKKLDMLNIPIAVICSEQSFEGAYITINRVGEILHVKNKSDSIITKMKTDVEEVTQKVNQIQTRPTLYYVIGFGKTGDFTAGGNTFISKMIEMAGGRNIASDVSGWSYSLEKLIEKDPDIILIRTGNKEIFVKSPSYSDLKAVKNNNVYEINDDLFEITGPRLSEGLKQLFMILHP